MTVIDKETMDALGDVQRDRVAQGILAFVAGERASALAGLSRAQQMQAACIGMDRAAAWGVPPHHGATVLFAALRFLTHPRFDQHPACRAILENRELPPEARVFALLDRSMGVPWHDIARQPPAAPPARAD